jgi:hypothetical protein
MSSGPINRVRTGVLAAALLLAGASGQTIDEYHIKAAFLYNFAKFVVWPPQVFKSPTDPIAICVLGQSAITHPIEEAVADKKIEGRGIAVSTISDIKGANVCQILFVSSAERQRLRSFPQDFRMVGILTVGETEGFAAEGGVINFKLDGGKVRFEINKDAADKKGLKISSKLLSLAEIVKPGVANTK